MDLSDEELNEHFGDDVLGLPPAAQIRKLKYMVLMNAAAYEEMRKKGRENGRWLIALTIGLTLGAVGSRVVC